MLNVTRKIFPLFLPLALSIFLIGCQKEEGPKESTGKKMDQSIQELNKTFDEMQQKMEDSAKEMQKNMEENYNNSLEEY